MQEPQSPDQTSTPPDQPPQGQTIQQVLGQRKKRGFGPSVKNPGALAGAIARAKRARQTGQKYGN